MAFRIHRIIIVVRNFPGRFGHFITVFLSGSLFNNNCLANSEDSYGVCIVGVSGVAETEFLILLHILLSEDDNQWFFDIRFININRANAAVRFTAMVLTAKVSF